MIPDYPLSAPVRDGAALARLDSIDDLVRDAAIAHGAREVQYPVLIAHDALERAEYPRAFPHLMMSAHSLHPQPADSRDDTPPAAERAEWCLSPAVCYHSYVELAGRVVREPILITARGRCFRNECHTAPGIRQVEFEMREIVLLGPRLWIEGTADAVRRDVEALARGVGLDGTWQEAEDPFFLPSAGGKALMQRLLKLKIEYVLCREQLAIASVNRHATFFGDRFRITTPDDAAVHTACIAVGLDRWWQHARRSNEETVHDLR